MKESFTTMITPYKENGEIDFSAAEKYVDYYFSAGLTGIFATCLSSEIFQLSLSERTELNRRVYARAKQLESKYGRPFTVVSSGHISDDFEDQARELNAVYESGTDALILITNRLCKEGESDETLIRNAEKLISRLPKAAKLGLYECPVPYKRLVSKKVLEWAVSTGRFYYMKDTCCDGAEIARRCEVLKGSHFKLLNANCQTLLESLRAGADGYCGIMCNFHPALYAYLTRNFEKEPEKAEIVQGVIGTFGFIEGGLTYPLTAKYSMGLCGMPSALIARNKPGATLDDYAKSCVKQMKTATDALEKTLNINKGE